MRKLKRWPWVVIAGSFFILSLLGTAQGKDPAPPKKTPDLLSKGKKIFEQTCSLATAAKGTEKARPEMFSSPLPRTLHYP